MGRKAREVLDANSIVVWNQDDLELAADPVADSVVRPTEWLAPSASGTPAECAAAVRHQLDLGCDGVILHGDTSAGLRPIVDAHRAASAMEGASR